MGETKPKKLVRRRAAANSPEPTGPTCDPTDPACGHSHCGDRCNVFYAGPTSRISDHHILHAARGATHVWTAAIVSGLAVVITGAIAFRTADASSSQVIRNQAAQQATQRDIKQVNERLDAIQEALKDIQSQCVVSPSVDEGDSQEMTEGNASSSDAL